LVNREPNSLAVLIGADRQLEKDSIPRFAQAYARSPAGFLFFA